jgi:hypothetical protein
MKTYINYMRKYRKQNNKKLMENNLKKINPYLTAINHKNNCHKPKNANPIRNVTCLYVTSKATNGKIYKKAKKLYFSSQNQKLNKNKNKSNIKQNA